MRRVGMLVSVAFVASIAIQTAPAAQAALPLPNNIASIGDSITRAYDACCSYGDHPANSWSTGSSSTDGVRSHYERILASNLLVSGQQHNDAVTGAKMSDGGRQAAQAVAQAAQYVTILLGANDVCTSSASTMTSTGTFRNQLESAMSTLQAGLPIGAHIFVGSIPNVYRLWSVLRTNWLARITWSAAKICQSMLSSSNTEQTRQAVLAREKAFNDILADVCGRFANCRFDGYAVFNYPFAADQISKLDYFHPSLSGQAALAGATWAASWWPGS